MTLGTKAGISYLNRSVRRRRLALQTFPHSKLSIAATTYEYLAFVAIFARR